MIKLSRIWIMFYSDSRQNNITFYTADWKSEMKMPGILVQCQQCQQCAELKWPIIILLTLTFVAAAGKLKLLLSVAIISNYSLIIIRRWRPHINNKRNTHRYPIILTGSAFLFCRFGLQLELMLRNRKSFYGTNSIYLVGALTTHKTKYREQPIKDTKKIMLELQ